MKYEKSCGCIIIHKNKVLLVEHNEGHWDFPKGHMEENETEIQTAIREVKEETNLDVLVQENKRYVSEYYPKEEIFKQVIFFLATCKMQDIKRQEAEIKNIEWLTFEDAIKKITHNNSKNILKQIMQDINVNKELEEWDLYDENRKKINKTCKRNEKLKVGEYHLIANAIILNSENKILISKRAVYKKFPLMWECAGGSILKGETSLEGIIRELKEELGVEFTTREANLLKTIKDENDFKDLWLFKKNIDIRELNFKDGEELDCYILGVFDSIEEFTGKCIALIHRTNDDDDKLILVPEGKEYTKEQIKVLTEFQEQYFQSEIIN